AWASHPDRVQRLLSEPDFGHLRTVQAEAERETIPIDHEHPFGALALLGEPDLVATLLGRRERAVEEGHTPIEPALLVEAGECRAPDALPQAFLAPAMKTPPHRRRRSVFAREVLPAAARDEDVEDAFDGTTVVRPRSPSVGWRWQQGADKGPLPV